MRDQVKTKYLKSCTPLQSQTHIHRVRTIADACDQERKEPTLPPTRARRTKPTRVGLSRHRKLLGHSRTEADTVPISQHSACEVIANAKEQRTRIVTK